MPHPENDLATFVSYLPDALRADLRALRSALAGVTTNVPDVASFKHTRPPRPLNAADALRQRRALDTNQARVALVSILALVSDQPPPAVAALDAVNAEVERHELEAALTQLDTLPPPLPPPTVPPTALAFRTSPVQYATIEEGVETLPNGTEINFTFQGPDATLPGFPAAARPTDEQLAALLTVLGFLTGGSERTFRVGIMRGALHMGAGRNEQALEQHAALLADPAIDERHLKAVAIQAGFAHLAEGDTQFRRAVRPDDVPRRTVAADEYAAAITVLDAQAVAADNPMRIEIERRAQTALAQLDAGLNFLGYHDGYVPLLRGEVLKEAARLRLEEADSAVRQYVAFKSSAQEIQDRLRDLAFESDIKAKELDMLDAEIGNAEDQAGIAASRRDHLAEQIDGLDTTLAADLGGALIGAAASAFLAPGAKGDPGGTNVPGIAGAFSGAITAVAGYRARRDDLEFQKAISEVEQRVAERDIAIVRQRREIAVATLESMGEQIRRIQARELGAELFFAAAESFRRLAGRHLDAAIQWAYLYERAVIFKRLVDDPHQIRFEYARDPGGLLTAVDALRADLTAVEEADVPQTKFQLLAETYSLRSLFAVEFDELLRTGAMDFTFSLFEVNKRRPGVHRQRIKQVEVKVEFPPPSGFTGRIIHGGSFMLRDRDTTLAASTFMPSAEELQAAIDALGDGAAQGTPVGGVIPFVLDLDSIELSADPTTGEADPAAQALIEGYGAAGNWRLEIENVDMRHISDVLLTITFLIPESDPQLAAKVKELIATHEAEVLFGGEAPDLISPFSLRNRFPAELVQLANGSVDITLRSDDFPTATSARRLKTAVIQAVDAAGKGVPGIALELSRPGTAFTRAGTTGDTGFSEDLAGHVTVLDPADRPAAEGAYLVRLPDPTQLQQVNDLLLLVLFEYEQE